jgi:hypothetical protein
MPVGHSHWDTLKGPSIPTISFWCQRCGSDILEEHCTIYLRHKGGGEYDKLDVCQKCTKILDKAWDSVER